MVWNQLIENSTLLIFQNRPVYSIWAWKFSFILNKRQNIWILDGTGVVEKFNIFDPNLLKTKKIKQNPITH